MAFDDTIRSILDQKSSRIWDVAPETPVYDALQLMAEKDVGALLVIAGTELRGIFSERDYARKVVLEGKTSKYTRVSDIMSAPPIVASPRQTANDGLRLMNKYRIRHLPIVEYGIVIGIISIGDLVNWIMGRQQEEIDQLNQYISAAAMMAGQ
jgi:CBS domain-containing protein